MIAQDPPGQVGGTIEPGDTARINLTTVDADTSGSQDQVRVFVCADGNTFNGTACSGGGGDTFCSTSLAAPGATSLCVFSSTRTTVPTAHGSFPVEVFVVDSHGLVGTQSSDFSYTVQDVVPTLVSNTSPSSPIIIAAGSSTAVNFSAVVADNNGDGDVTAIEGIFWDDSASAGALENNCAADENDCYIDVTCVLSGVSTPGTGKTATGTDANLTASCSVTAFFNANASTDWEVHVNPTDGNGKALGLGDSNDNTEISAVAGLSTVQTTIPYGSVAPAATSDGVATSVGNAGNVVVDFTVEGTDMTCTDTAACIADPIVKGQQVWIQSGGFAGPGDWGGPGHTLLASGGAGTADANGCANVGLLIRNVAAATTENENIYWKITIPSPQAEGTYTGSNTLAVISDTSCTGTP